MATTSSSNYTSLYGANGSPVVPSTPYGNANVVALLATSTDGSNTIGNISATGNISGNYFIGNGSLLTGISGGGSSYNDSNVATFLAAFGSNAISTTGNVTATNFIGNGAGLTGITVTAGTQIINGTSNVSVALNGNTTVGVAGTTRGTFSPGQFSVNGNVRTSGFISATGDVYGELGSFGNVNSGGYVTAGGDISGFNIGAGGYITAGTTISAAGNITAGSGSFFLGNGSQLTGITTTIGPTISVTGNITGGNINTGGVVSAGGNVRGANIDTSGVVSATGNVRGGNINSSGIVSSTGNVIAPYFIGNGSALTGITTTYGDSNVTTLLAGFGSNTISTTGNITGGNVRLQSGGEFVGSNSTKLSYSGPTGRLNILGSGDTIASSSLYAGDISAYGNVYADNGFVSAIGNVRGANINTAGDVSAGGNIYLGGSNKIQWGTSATMTQVNGSPSQVDFTVSLLNISGNVGGGNLNTTGSVSAVGNITGGNIITTGAFNPASISTAGNITGGNLISTGSLLSPQFTTTGVSGNISGVNYITANYFVGNGSLLTSISGGTAITNGTSTVAIGASGGNANVSIGGTSNVVVFSSTGANIAGFVDATGAVNGSSINTSGAVGAGSVTGPSGSSGVQVYNYKDAVVTITYASTITPNIALGSIQQVTLTGPVTMNAFGGTPQAGQSMVIKFIQDATGGRTLSSTMKWAGGNKTLSTAANAVDIASVFYDGTNYYASLTLAYA